MTPNPIDPKYRLDHDRIQRDPGKYDEFTIDPPTQPEDSRLGVFDDIVRVSSVACLFDSRAKTDRRSHWALLTEPRTYDEVTIVLHANAGEGAAIVQAFHDNTLSVTTQIRDQGDK